MNDSVFAQEHRVVDVPVSYSPGSPVIRDTDVLVFAAGGNAPGQTEYVKALAEMSPALAGHQLSVVIGGAAELVREDGSKPRILRLKASLAPEAFQIGTSRPGKSPETLARLTHHIRQLGFSKVVIIGGDGTLSMARYLEEHGIGVIGIPKSMDGNLAFCKSPEDPVRINSLGFTSSALHAIETANLLQNKAWKTRSIGVLEVNGRNTGWLPMTAGWLSGAIFFVKEHKPDLSDLLRAAQSLHQGGLILVSESVDFFENGEPADLQSKLDQPLPVNPDFLIEAHLTGLGVSARRIDLGELLTLESSMTAMDEIGVALHLLSTSARVQSRVNVVTVPRPFSQEWIWEAEHIRLPAGVKCWPRKVLEPEKFLQEVADEVRAGKVHVLLIPEALQINLDKKRFTTDSCGRTRFQNREISRSVAAFVHEATGRRTFSTTLTHLLMARPAKAADKAYATHLAEHTVKALAQGRHGVVLAQTFGNQRPLSIPLSRLGDLEVPRSYLKPWQGWRYGIGR